MRQREIFRKNRGKEGKKKVLINYNSQFLKKKWYHTIQTVAAKTHFL
jgi:hypothetical protein